MDSSAPSSRLMTTIRSGFQQQGGLTLTSRAPQVSTPVASSNSSLHTQLDVLDQVLTEVEQTGATNQPSSPIVANDPVTSTPVSMSTADPTVPDSSVQPQPPVVDAVPSMSAPSASVTPTPAPFDPSAQVMPQLMNQAVDQATNTLQAGYVGSTAKESSVATPLVESGAGIQFVETEKTPEIPVEVESYLQKVEQQEIQLPDEIVIADQTATPLASHYVKQPVIVLPITPEMEAHGARQNPFQSVRWLVEFSRKIMKMFTGKVVYRVSE